MADFDYTGARKQAAYLTALCDAHDAVVAGKALKEDEPKETLEAQKISASNIALAGSSAKAEILGTLSAAPSMKTDDLVKIGMETKYAEAVMIEAATIRADALALREVKP
ncbi:MAG: hypothetical protein WC734_05890 [Patescibacteria group bacterium]|jgi:hypothetical protein